MKRQFIYVHKTAVEVSLFHYLDPVHVYIAYRDRYCRDCMVVGFTTSYAISAYH
jgi:hypothetical protein